MTVTVADGAATPPTVTTTGCTPVGAASGITKLIWEAPTRPEATPTNTMRADAPPTVTVTGSSGCGNRLMGVSKNGVAPSVSTGETEPSPVMNASSVSPRLAVEK